jgi:xanthine dehydrogenase molybdopterin-binding subunit B
MIDLEYFTEELKTDGFEVAVFIDANETLDHRVHSKNHDHKYKSDKGFHIDGSIDGSIATYTRNCGLSNTLSKPHAETGTAIPNTYMRGTLERVETNRLCVENCRHCNFYSSDRFT